MKRAGSVCSLAVLALLAVAPPIAASPAAADTRRVDPTRPLGGAAAPAPVAGARAQPLLTSVLIAPGRRMAVINGRTMAEGDAIDGVRVWRISPAGVEVSVDGAPRVRLDLDNPRMRKE